MPVALKIGNNSIAMVRDIWQNTPLLSIYMASVIDKNTKRHLGIPSGLDEECQISPSTGDRSKASTSRQAWPLIVSSGPFALPATQKVESETCNLISTRLFH